MDNNKKVSETRQFIVANLGGEQYGIDIKYIDNIVKMTRITRVPKSQPYYLGIINLRGEVIPVMSLRLKFGLPEDEITNATRIIIVKLDDDSGSVGILVDAVKEVITLSMDDVDTKSGSGEKAKYLMGVGQNNGTLVTLLNLSAVVIDRREEPVKQQ
jgi:purine-binding chemotaxis protein CheW